MTAMISLSIVHCLMNSEYQSVITNWLTKMMYRHVSKKITKVQSDYDNDSATSNFEYKHTKNSILLK